MAITGCLTAAAAFGVFAWEMTGAGDIGAARNAAFSTLVLAELLRAFGARSDEKLVVEIGLFSNARLFGIVAVSLALQLLLHHVALLERLFGTQPITLRQGLAWFAVAALPLAALEGHKWVRRWRRRRSPAAPSQVR